MHSDNLEIMFTEEEIHSRISDIAQRLNDLYGQEEVVAVCCLKGSVIFAADLVRELKMPLKMEFIRLSSYGSSKTTSGKVSAVDIELPDLKGKNVLIIEDIVDTGLTAKFLVDYIHTKFDVKSLKFCSLLNKINTRKAEIQPDYYCFEVDNKFIVGYGLDNNGLYRNLKYIAYVN